MCILSIIKTVPHNLTILIHNLIITTKLIVRNNIYRPHARVNYVL